MSFYKEKKQLISLLLLSVFLSGCTNKAPAMAEPTDYLSSLAFHEDFKVLQFTDLHWNIETNVEKEKAYLNKVVETAGKVDCLFITGDNNLWSNKEVTTALFRHIQSYDIPYAVLWGNHDRGNEYSFSWLESLVKEGKSLYKNPLDQVEGDSNYAVNVMDGSTIKWRLYALDSHSDVQTSAIRYQYPPLSERQKSWFSSLAEETKVGGTYTPSLVYCHIPLEEVQAAVDNKDGKRTYEKWEHLESISPSYKPSGFFTLAKEKGVKGIFWGHDHANDYTADYDGVTLGYGVKTGRELYYIHSSKRNMDMTGASLVTLKGNGTFALSHLYVADTSDYETHVENYK